MSESIELTGDVHDLLLNYQRDDETLQDTLERVVPAVLPHPVDVRDAGIDPKTLDDETRFVLERWPDGGGYVDTWLYGSKTDYLRANKTVIEHTDLEPRGNA